MEKIKNIERECPACGIVYSANIVRLKHGRQTTCSRSCSYKIRAANLENNIEIICSVCKSKFKRPVSRIKGKHGFQFCSGVCMNNGRMAGMSKRIVTKPYNITEAGRIAWIKGAQKTREKRIARDNYRHSDETKAKLSYATSRAISEGRIKRSSGLEIKVRKVMVDLGIIFKPQFPVRFDNGRYACVFDFFIPSHNTVVEVNGTFYHSDPRFFPSGPIHEIQKRNAICWQRKIDIIKERGHFLIEIWEEDIKKGGEKHIMDCLRPII